MFVLPVALVLLYGMIVESYKERPHCDFRSNTNNCIIMSDLDNLERKPEVTKPD